MHHLFQTQLESRPAREELAASLTSARASLRCSAAGPLPRLRHLESVDAVNAPLTFLAFAVGSHDLDLGLTKRDPLL